MLVIPLRTLWMPSSRRVSMPSSRAAAAMSASAACSTTISLIRSLRPIAESPLPRATLSLLHVPPTQVAPRFVALPAPADQSQFMLLEERLPEPAVALVHADARHKDRGGGHSNPWQMNFHP